MSAAIQSSASLIRGTALIVSINERFSGQSGFMYAPKIAWLSRIGIRAGLFLWSVFVANDAPIHGQLVIVPMISATSARSSRVVSSSAFFGSDLRSIAAPFLKTLVAARAATRELT